MYIKSVSAFICFILIAKTSATYQQLRGFDYIIVGAGSAGATLASRLSEDYPISVLLLEAGGLPTEASEIPLFAGKLWESAMDWNYTIISQNGACLGYKDNSCILSAGKALGGSSSINQMLYIRGNRHDYDRWVEAGALGWSYEEVLPYYQRAEDNRITNHLDFAFHGFNGPLTVSEPSYITPLQQAYIDGGQQVGLKWVDFNGKQQSGIGKIQTTTRKGSRCSTEKAYLRPAYGRRNLNIIAKAHVTKILFDENNRARTVLYDFGGKSYFADARREIILSAGAYNTPKLLMLSGIGPKQHLESLGIKVVADLPVGLNMQDHAGAVGSFYTINTTDTLVLSRYNDKGSKEKYEKGLGPLTSPGGVEAVAFFKSQFVEKQGDYPDTELIFNSVLLQFPRLNEKMLNYFKALAGQDIFTIISIALHPKSRGSVRLNSTDPYQQPILDHQFFSEEEDLKITVEGMKKGRAIAESEAMKRFGVRMVDKPIPGCENLDLRSDAYLACVAQTVTMSMYHAVGTCKMGQPTDPSTVVDPLLRVKGIRGLRVVDNSVIPVEISGHTNAVAIMIGERAADLIRFSHLNHSF